MNGIQIVSDLRVNSATMPSWQVEQDDFRIVLDMFVLGQAIKTGVHRVCEEVFPRLAMRQGITTRFLLPDNPDFAQTARQYIDARKIPGVIFDDRVESPEEMDVLLLPFSPADQRWVESGSTVKAIIVYDLIALMREDLATPEITNVVRSIVDSITPDMVVFAISNYTKRDLLAYRPDLSASQITVIPLAAPAHYFLRPDKERRVLMREKYGIPPEIPYILSLATLEVRKNLDHIVKAFVQFCGASPDNDVRLVLSGMRGWKLEKLESSLQQAGTWRSRIILTGFVDEEDMPSLYSDALCFVYMSRYEGFGLPPLEAMTCGVPVISSNTSSLPEVVGDAGINLDPDDTVGLVQAMRDLTANDALRAELIQKGLARARIFSWDACADIISETLRAAVRKKRAAISQCGSRKPESKNDESVKTQDKLVSSPIDAATPKAATHSEMSLLSWGKLALLGFSLGAFVISTWVLPRSFAWIDFGLGCMTGAGALHFIKLLRRKMRNK